VIERYKRSDNSKLKELSLRLEKTHGLIYQHKKQLAQEITETQSMQIELDRVRVPYGVMLYAVCITACFVDSPVFY